MPPGEEHERMEEESDTRHLEQLLAVHQEKIADGFHSATLFLKARKHLHPQGAPEKQERRQDEAPPEPTGKIPEPRPVHGGKGHHCDGCRNHPRIVQKPARLKGILQEYAQPVVKAHELVERQVQEDEPQHAPMAGIGLGGSVLGRPDRSE
jgi:hypothetical protein